MFLMSFLGDLGAHFWVKGFGTAFLLRYHPLLVAGTELTAFDDCFISSLFSCMFLKDLAVPDRIGLTISYWFQGLFLMA